MNEERMKELALLSAIRGMREEDSNEEIYVSSLSDAIDLLQQHMGPSGAKYRRKLVEYISNPENRVFGKCDVYHNFIMYLFGVGEYDLALPVCDIALARAPYNRDILGDAIKACGESSQFAIGEEYLSRAMEIPANRWTYRLFLYSVGFLQERLSAYPMDEELYQRAETLVKAYIENYPFDEHGYNQYAELLIMMNDREKAIEMLDEYIFSTHPDKGDSKTELIAAQCCLTLIDLLDDSNDYDRIINICEKGLKYTTKEQPSARVGYFMYRKGLALDAKAHAERSKNPDEVKQILKIYQAAYDLNQDTPYARTIELRYAALRPHAKEFQPLVKRKLYVTEDDVIKDVNI